NKASAYLCQSFSMTRPLVAVDMDEWWWGDSRGDPALSEGRERLGLGREDLEDPGETRDLEDLVHGRVHAGQVKGAAHLLEPLHRREEGPEADAADVVESLEINDELRVSAVDGRAESI